MTLKEELWLYRHDLHPTCKREVLGSSQVEEIGRANALQLSLSLDGTLITKEQALDAVRSGHF